MISVSFWTHEGVASSGGMGGRRGHVVTEAEVRSTVALADWVSLTNGGGYWLSVSAGRSAEGRVSGMTVTADSEEELREFFENQMASCVYRKDLR